MNATTAQPGSGPLQIAVVGHTNVGKTSLLRTLLHDVEFGEVSHRPSTTRHVEGAALGADGQALLVLQDTPGLEDGIGLRDYLERLAQMPAGGLSLRRGDDGPALLETFMQSAESRDRYEQEAKVLRQLQASDAGLYVVDVREPVLPKYRDELAVLVMAGRPLLPVFNFVNAPQTQESQWRDVLARLGLHAAVRFDTVAPPVDGEQRLYQSLAVLLGRAASVLQRLQDGLRAQAAERRQAALRLVAELLLDVAATQLPTAADAGALQRASAALHQAVRQREQRGAQALLALYAFRQGDAVSQGLPGFDGVWAEDLFSAELLKRLGVRIGGGMAAGAAVGAGIDAMVAGLSLGSATLAGALVGGAYQTLRDHGQRWLGRLRGERVLRVDDPVLCLLALRQLGLIQALEARGHAAQQAIHIDELALRPAQGSGSVSDWRRGRVPEALHRARAHPEWSSFHAVHGGGDAAYARQARVPRNVDQQRAVAAVAERLGVELSRDQAPTAAADLG